MKSRLLLFSLFLIFLSLPACNTKEIASDMNIIFLHHSTGEHIWNGKPPSLFNRAVRKISRDFAMKIRKKGQLPKLFEKYNENNDTSYLIDEMEFPRISPYGWNNNPYDYYNIWVKNAGNKPFKEEPTLEMLTKEYDVIIFKHCFPVSNIQPDLDSADIDSYYASMENYKLQYDALRKKLHEFPNTKFILFTGPVQVKANLSESEATRAREFFIWVREEWNLTDDNIHLWDLYELETEGKLYFKAEYAVSTNDSHPNKKFASGISRLLFNRIIDVIENDGEKTTLTGIEKDQS